MGERIERILECGFRISECSTWNIGFWKVDFGFRNAPRGTLDFGRWISDLGMFHVEHWILEGGFRIWECLYNLYILSSLYHVLNNVLFFYLMKIRLFVEKKTAFSNLNN
jgi:hypothetical protein